MRRMIAAMQLSVDSKIEGPDGYADWVESWSDTYDLMPQVDACLLGAHMYPGYEQYWNAIEADPGKPLELTGKTPTQAEIEYAHFATRTPHYVLSKSLDAAVWPNTKFLRDIGEVGHLKKMPGKDIYVVGGAQTTASLIDLGYVDELRLTLHPLISGMGKALFETSERRHHLQFLSVRPLDGGRVSLRYDLAGGS